MHKKILKKIITIYFLYYIIFTLQLIKNFLEIKYQIHILKSKYIRLRTIHFNVHKYKCNNKCKYSKNLEFSNFINICMLKEQDSYNC